MKPVYAALIASLCFCYCHLPAQDTAINYSIQHFNNDNGLLQNGIFNIEWDKEGFCWLASQYGLIRFDGRNFKVFTKNEVRGLQTNFFTTFSKDAAGDLFSKDDYGNGVKIITGNQQASHPLSVSDSFLTGDKGYLYRGKNYATILADYLTSPLIKIAINRKHYFGVNDSAIYFFSRDKGWYLKGKQAIEFAIARPIGYKEGIVSDITMIGNLFIIIHKQNDIECFREGIKQRGFSNIEGDIARDKKFEEGNFRMLWCSAGSFICTGKKLYALNVSNNHLITTLVFNNLHINSAVSIYLNTATGCYYIVTNNDGFYVLKRHGFQSITIPADAVFSNIYFNQQATPDGAVFANNKKFYANGAVHNFWLGSQRTNILCNYKNEYLWYSFLDSLIACSFNKNKPVAAYHFESPVSSYCVSAFNDSLFFSSGFSVFSITENQVQWLFKNDSFLIKKSAATPDNEITAMGILHNGNFLIGTHNGLYQYNILKQSMELIGSGLQVVKIWCEKNGDSWVATNGNGLYCYKNSHLGSLPLALQNPVTVVYEFLEDSQHFFWIATDLGLIKVKKQVLLNYIQNSTAFLFAELYDKTNGYTTNEFNGGATPSAVYAGNGLYSFATSRELVWFYPSLLQSSYVPSSLYIDEIRIDGKALPLTQTIDLKPGSSSLSIKVSTPQFGNTNANAISFALNDDTLRWEKLPDNNTLVFNKLPHGNYIIRLRKGNTDGGYNTIQQSFTILPYFYESWWFKLLLLLLALSGIYLFVRLRLRLLQQQKVKLEETVSNRTTELQTNIYLLQNTIKELEQSEEKIYQASQFKEKIISIILHDLRSPLRFISSVSSELLQSHSHISPNQLKDELGALSNESGSIYNFTNELLTWIYAQQSDYIIQKKEVALDEVLEQVYTMYKLIAAQRKNKLVLHPGGLYLLTDENMLKIIIRNLADNATKYTYNGTIEIMAKQAAGAVTITIADTGIGMEETTMLALNASGAYTQSSSKKLGLLLLTELTKKLKGTAHFSANTPSGTLVRITLPAM